MTAEIPPYIPLEDSVAKNSKIVIEALKKDADINIDKLDMKKQLITTPIQIEWYTTLFQSIAQAFEYEDPGAWQTAYRAHFFAYATAELVGEYDFELALPISTENGTFAAQKMLVDATNYIVPRPMIGDIIDEFIDEIDISGQGQFSALGRVVAASTFRVIEGGMRETYLQAAAVAIGENY